MNPEQPYFAEGETRSLSRVLLRLTLTITLALGILATFAMILVDLQREKDAVEGLATDILESAAPSAESAVYVFSDDAAQQVAEGLFLVRAVTAIRIVNDGKVVVDEQRVVAPTLPQISFLSGPDKVDLTRVLHEPGTNGTGPVIGQMSITIDKSLVAPEIISRLLTTFVVTTTKNVVFGLILFWTVFHVLTRHIGRLTYVTQKWHPGMGAIKVPDTPGILRMTEVEQLGTRVSELTKLASGALDKARRSHDAVVDDNQLLSAAVKNRTRELEQVNLRLQRMADHDGLTGLYNRASFDRIFAKMFDEMQASQDDLAILLIDVDHFKPFNDFYGHQAGDQALKRVAEILRNVQNETGCIMARYGGEEFVGILNEKDAAPEDVEVRIHAALHDAAIDHQHSTVARQITVSIGIATTSEGSAFDNADMLVSAADDALYEAKRSGRNQTVASSAVIRQTTQDNRDQINALMDAIEAEEFEPFGQPQVDARTGELVGIEALVRWVRPDGTVVPAKTFLPTAEKVGLLKKIDMMVLDKLTGFLCQNPGRLPRVSINVTGECLAADGYVERIVKLAQSSETKIALELLETILIDQPDDLLLWQLDTLRSAGVAIEIDDFGTGRTSILGLRAIGPDRLKIARELILPLDEQEDQKQLVISILEIAKTMDIKVVAEGVELEETARLLVDIGCPIQQGYYHGKPARLSDIISLAQGLRQVALVGSGALRKSE